MLVYHGTKQIFTEFDSGLSDGIFYFTEDRAYAEHRARARVSPSDSTLLDGGPRVVAADVEYEKPFLAPKKKLSQSAVAELLGIPEDGFFMNTSCGARIGYPVSYFWSFLRQNPRPMVESLRLQGFDAISMKEGFTCKSRPCFSVLAVFSLAQIRIRLITRI